MPSISRISTFHIEKQNHMPRMRWRRLTRLTNALSKKLENFQAAVSLNFLYNADGDEKFTVVLEIPPVVDVLTAVRVSIAAESKGKK